LPAEIRHAAPEDAVACTAGENTRDIANLAGFFILLKLHRGALARSERIARLSPAERLPMTATDNDLIGQIPIVPPEKPGSPTPRLPTGPEKRADSVHKDKKRAAAPPPRRWPRRILLTALALAILFFLSWTWLVPYLLTDGLGSALSRRLDREVTIGRAEVSLFPLRLSFFNGIVGPLRSAPGDNVDPFCSFAELQVEPALGRLLAGKLSPRSLSLRHPFLHLVRSPENTYNLIDLYRRLRPAASRNSSAAGLAVQLLQGLAGCDLTVADGRMTFDDRLRNATHKLEDINVRLPRPAGRKTAGNASRREIPHLSAMLDGSPLSLTGGKGEGPNASTHRLHLALDDIDLTACLAYLPGTIDYRLLSGTGSLALDIELPVEGAPAAGGMAISGSVTLQNLHLQNEQEADITIAGLALRGSYATDTGSLLLHEIVIDTPSIPIAREKNGNWMLPGRSIFTAWTGMAGEDRRLLVDRLEVQRGRLSFVDSKVQGGYSGSWHDIALVVRHVELPASGDSSFTLEAFDMQGHSVALDGELNFSSPFAVRGSFNIERLGLQELKPYLAVAVPSRQLQDGTLERCSGNFYLKGSSPDTPFQGGITKAKCSLAGFRMRGEGDSYSLPAASLEGIELDVAGRKLTVGRLDAPAVACEVDRQLVAALLDGAKPQAGSNVDAAAPPPWGFLFGETSIAKLTVKIHEAEGENTALLFHDLQARQLGTEASPAGSIAGSVDFEPSGSLRFSGQATLRPFAAELRIEGGNLAVALLPFSWSSWLRPQIESGELQVKGTLKLPFFHFAGSFSTENFLATENGMAILGWRQAIANGAELMLVPFSLSIKSVVLDQPSLNWPVVDGHAASQENRFFKTEADRQQNLRIRIDNISLHGGKLHYANQTVNPPLVVDVRQIAGSVTGLESKAGNRAHLSLSGSLQETASLSVAGEFGFFDPLPYRHFTAETTDLRLAPLSSQLENVLGFEVAGGVLDMETDFRQEKGEIVATNDLHIKDFKQGRQLNPLSQLPLTLALLTDDSGIVHLSVPVKGDTADANFSYRNNFLQIFRNLLLKTAVSPFAILNTLIPKRNALDLDHVSFAFGMAELSDSAKAQLEDISRAVKLRPWLSIGIKGEADAGEDWQAIAAKRKQAIARRQIQQMRQMTRELSREYGKEEITPPPGPVPEGGLSVDEFAPEKKELVALAEKRATTVYDALLSMGVDRRRLRLLDQVNIVPADAKGKRGNRAALQLGIL